MRTQWLIKPRRECRTMFGAVMECDLRDFVQRRVYFFGVFEPHLTWLMQQTVRPGDVVLDIGANVGYFSLLASKLTGPSGKVVAVEADAAIHGALRKNLALNAWAGNVDARHVAVTESPCQVVTAIHAAWNLGSTVTRPAEHGQEGAVSGLPLDVIVGDDALSRTSFVKIDIEGAEGPALRVLLDRLSDMPARLTISVELSEANATVAQEFISQGFDAFVLPNIYDVDVYLAHRLGRHQLQEMRPVTAWVPGQADYVLIRRLD